MLTFFGGEPLLNLPVMYYLAERAVARGRGARRRDEHQHHHQRPAADAGGGRSPAAVRPERHQDHARRRSRHAQPDAPAARRPGHLRPDHREHPPASPAACRIAIGGNFDESSVDSYPGAARVPAASRSSPTSWSRSTSSRSIRDRAAAPAPQGHAAADAGRARRQAAGRHLHDVGRQRRPAARPATPATSLDDKMSFLREETQAPRLPDAGRRAQRPVPRAHDSTRTPSARTARSTRARDSPASSALSTGHIDDRRDPLRATAREQIRPAQPVEGMRRLRVHPRVCRGMPGRIAHQLGDMNMPTCHKRSFESAVISLAHQRRQRCLQETTMKNHRHQEGRQEREAPGLLPGLCR